MQKRTQLTYAQAIREALIEEMQRDESIVLMGQDIKKSVWGVTSGIAEQFAADRVLPLPISENGFCGAAVGAALTELRPVVEFMFGDFLLLAMDAICNQAAKYRYMCGGGEFKVPLVVRLAGSGIGSGGGQHHSQSPENWALPFPGLKIVTPATPNDAKGLMKSALKENNPVLFIEYKQLYSKQGVIEEEGDISLGKAKIVRSGKGLTLVTYATGYYKSLEAVEKAAAKGIDVEVIDLRTIKPIDKETIINSVKKTNKIVIVEDNCKTGGVGAHIASLIAEEALGYLDAPIVRVAGDDTSIPAGKKNEQMLVPSVEDIIKGIESMV